MKFGKFGESTLTYKIFQTYSPTKFSSYTVLSLCSLPFDANSISSRHLFESSLIITDFSIIRLMPLVVFASLTISSYLSSPTLS